MVILHFRCTLIDTHELILHKGRDIVQTSRKTSADCARIQSIHKPIQTVISIPFIRYFGKWNTSATEGRNTESNKCMNGGKFEYMTHSPRTRLLRFQNVALYNIFSGKNIIRNEINKQWKK